MADYRPTDNFRRTPFLVLCTVVLMVGLQITAKHFSGSAALRLQKPGPTRGDLVLVEDDLPSELAGWKRTRFTPAPLPEELPAGQFWWVHQWLYASHKTSAIVSFDQLGEDQWHELTICYRGRGWTIRNRTEYAGTSNDEGPYVVADLVREPNEQAWLVFSVFFEDGTWAAPPSVNLPGLNIKSKLPAWSDRIGDRVDPVVTFRNSIPGHRRALQCQVLVSGFSEQTDADLSSAIQLHRDTRHHLRSQWLSSRPVQSDAKHQRTARSTP